MSVTIKEPYVVGEKTSPLDYQYLDGTPSGAPINITGYSAEYHIQERYGPVVVLVATINDGPNGIVRHVFTGTEFSTPGEYWGQFWVGNGTNRYASTRIKFTVAAALGTVPSI